MESDKSKSPELSSVTACMRLSLQIRRLSPDVKFEFRRTSFNHQQTKQLGREVKLTYRLIIDLLLSPSTRLHSLFFHLYHLC